MENKCYVDCLLARKSYLQGIKDEKISKRLDYPQCIDSELQKIEELLKMGRFNRNEEFHKLMLEIKRIPENIEDDEKCEIVEELLKNKSLLEIKRFISENHLIVPILMIDDIETIIYNVSCDLLNLRQRQRYHNCHE